MSIASALALLLAVVVGGAGSAFADGTVPDAPPQPTVTPFNGAILVTFVAPFDGGSAILSYRADCTSFDGGAPGFNVGGASPIIVGSLTNGSSYTCTVFAHNAVGDGPTSPASDITMPTTVPDPPVKPTVLALNGSIIVSYTTPFDGGSAIDSYSASCTSPDGGIGGVGTGTALQSSIAVSPLSNGKTYTCTVSAHNSNGSGNPSPQSDPVVPNTTPDTPVKPTASTPLTGGISVAFTPPFDGGSAITGYTAACSSPDDPSSPVVGIGAASPVLVTGVLAGKSYTCTITATNANGNSGTSAASDAVSPGAAPDAPAQPTVSAGNSSIQVAFVPAATGATATSYTAQCASSNGGISSSNSRSASPIVVSGLTNGRSYTCTAKAANGFGSSPASTASTAVVPKSLPGVPGPPAVVAGNTRITVGFHAPGNGGFPINQYRVYCAAPGGVTRSLFTAATRLVVTGVTNGKRYRCNVTAHTQVGWGLVSPPSGIAIPHSHGFRVFTGDGGVFVFGDSPYYGRAHSASPVIAMITTPDNHGYWLVTQNGAVYPFGNARPFGSLAGRRLTRPIVGGTATPTGRGYWLVASDGGIFAFGDAHFYGSTGNRVLNSPIVGMTATASGRGYWFVAADGGLFAFGDAHYFGSAAGRVNARVNPIIGMATSAGGTGYWIAATNGAVFGFGTAHLSRPAIAGLRYPITGIASTDTGNGFWITAANGAVAVMGDAPFIQWPKATHLATYVRGITR